MSIIAFGDIHLINKNLVRETECLNFLNYIEEYASKNGIKHILCLGDVFDRGNNLRTESFLSIFNKFYEMKGRGLNLYFINGNHDQISLNDEHNSIVEAFKSLGTYIQKSATVNIDGYDYDCLSYTETVSNLPNKSRVMKNYTNNIVDMKINWRYSYKCFGILTSVGLFHLNKNKNKKFSFGLSQLQTYNSLVERYFLPKADDFFSNHVKFEEKLSCKDKPFLLIKVTKARIVRDEPIFYDNDIHEAGDESAFIAESANVNVKKGSKIKRFLIYFDTVDDIKKFIQFYNDNSDYIRNYCYEYGSTVLRMNRMPYIHYDGEIKHA